MSEAQHLKDVKKLNKHRAVGEACLNRHVGHYAASNTCSYRGQARKRALKDKDTYNWPAYQSLSGGPRVRTDARSKKGKLIPSWYKPTLAAPSKGDWDIKGNNFTHQCAKPYWHEAHHIVPNSTLRNAIARVGEGTNNNDEITWVIRAGLLDEGYNLNNRKNMIILPMDRRIALALGLPKHRKTVDHRSHPAYSKHVSSELDKKFQKMRNDAVKHKKINYAPCRKKIESLSNRLYDAIKDAGERMQAEDSKRDALDDMKPGELAARRASSSRAL